MVSKEEWTMQRRYECILLHIRKLVFLSATLSLALWLYTYARDAFRSFWLLNSVRARCSSLRCAEFFNRRKKMIFFGKVAKTTGYSKFECVSLSLSPSIFLRICCASIHMFSSRLASNCDLIAFCLLRAQPAFKHVLVYLPFLFSVCRISAFAFLYYSRFWVQTLRETKIMSFCRWKKSARACIRLHRRKKRWLRVIRMKINLSWTGSFPATEIYFELRKINFFYSMNFQFKNMKLGCVEMLFTLYNTSSPNLVQKRYCECLFVFSCYEKYSSIWNCACIITIHIKALKRDKYLWLKGHSGTQAPNRRSHSEVVYRLFAQHFQLTLICVDAFFLLHLWKKRTEISSCLLTTHLSKWIVDNVFAALYAKWKKK